MVEPLGHRQTKEAGTRMPDLTSPRHIPTLPVNEPARAGGSNYQGQCILSG